MEKRTGLDFHFSYTLPEILVFVPHTYSFSRYLSFIPYTETSCGGSFRILFVFTR